MRFLTKAESLRALAELPAADDGAAGPAELQVDIEDCLRRSAAAARLFARLIGTEQAVLLWINEFGIWPSLENRHLFEALRKTGGEARPLHEAPGHAFGVTDQDALVSYLQLAIAFGWGGILLGLENRHRLIVSHDGWASIRLLSEMAALVVAVSGFGLPYRVAERPCDTLAALGLSPDGELLNPK